MIGYTGPRESLAAFERDGVPRPEMYQFRTQCRLCSGQLARVLDLGCSPLANDFWTAEQVTSRRKQDEFPVVIGSCVACQHVQLMTVVSPERLYSEYSYTSGVAPSFRAHLESLAAELHEQGHRTIVDIGSNDGTLLGYCRRAGMRGIGVDPARNLAAEASSRGTLTVPAFFNADTARAIRELIGRPDVVTSLNSFAHCDGLGAIADGVRELIRDYGGQFVFEVAYLLDLLEKNEIGSLYHEHASSWHVAPMVPFFRAHGLDLVHVERIASQGGSLRCRVVAAGEGEPDGSVAAAIAEEATKIPPLLADWPHRVSREREGLRQELAPHLADPCKACAGSGGSHPPSGAPPWGPCPVCRGGAARRNRGTLAIFGAPARLTTFAYAMGLQHNDVRCVFDDEPRKIGKFTPGLHWAVVPSSELMVRNPPAILVASWNYFDEINARFPEYRGRWILPARMAAQ